MYISFARPIVYLSLVYLSTRLLSSRSRQPSERIAFAVRSDRVRRPIRLRPPSDQIASAVRSDYVRCPTVIPALLHCTNELKK